MYNDCNLLLFCLTVCLASAICNSEYAVDIPTHVHEYWIAAAKRGSSPVEYVK